LNNYLNEHRPTTSTIQKEDVPGQQRLNNPYAVHLFQHGIEKELERFKESINDDKIGDDINIIHLMLYQAISYLDKAYYYAAILEDMSLKGDKEKMSDIDTGKENDYINELCRKINKNYQRYELMISKINQIMISKKHLIDMVIKIEKPIVYDVINKLIEQKIKYIEDTSSVYCSIKTDIKKIIQYSEIRSMSLGGSKNNKRYKFYNAFLKEFKKSLKLK